MEKDKQKPTVPPPARRRRRNDSNPLFWYLLVLSITIVTSLSMIFLKILKLAAITDTFSQFVTWLPASISVDLVFGLLLASMCRLHRVKSSVPPPSCLSLKRILVFTWAICSLLLLSVSYSYWSFTSTFIDWKDVLVVLSSDVGASFLTGYGIRDFFISLVIHYLSTAGLLLFLFASLDNRSGFVAQLIVIQEPTTEPHATNLPLKSDGSLTHGRGSGPELEKENKKKVEPTEKALKIKVAFVAILFASCLAASSSAKLNMHQIVGNDWIDIGTQLGWQALFGDQIPVFRLEGGDGYYDGDLIKEIRASSVSQHKEKVFTPKHVVLIVGESIRKDVYPFDYENEKFASLLKPEVKANREVTPFITRLQTEEPDNLAVIDSFFTVSTFTHKALISLFCETWPLNAHFTVEHNMYQDCIPTLLRKMQLKNNSTWMSSFFAPIYTTFDNVGETLASFGFDMMFTADELKETGVPDVNYFGKDDLTVLPAFNAFLTEYYDKEVDKEKIRLFSSFQSSTTHGPYKIPRGIEKKQFINPTWGTLLPDYLAAVYRFDLFVQGIMDSFKKRDLMNDTLFVIVGDHAVPFNADHSCGDETNLGCFEETPFRPALMFYSQHPDFDAQKFTSSLKNRSWCDMDLAATLKEMMEISTPHVQESFKNYETIDFSKMFLPPRHFFGRSMMHPEKLSPENSQLERSTRTPLDRVLPMVSSPGGGDFYIRDPFEMKSLQVKRNGVHERTIDLLEEHVINGLSEDQMISRFDEDQPWRAWLTRYIFQLHNDLSFLYGVPRDIIVRW